MRAGRSWRPARRRTSPAARRRTPDASSRRTCGERRPLAQRECVLRERGVGMNTPVVDVEPVLAPADDVRRLVEELERELSQHYPAEQRHGLSLEKLFQPGVLFFVARIREEGSG